MDRVGAARERLRHVQLEMRSPAIETPCIQCRWYELACTNPAVSKISADPVTGSPIIKPVDAAEARSENGACGPEGALFDSRSLPGLFAVSLLTSTGGRWVLGIGALLGGALLFG